MGEWPDRTPPALPVKPGVLTLTKSAYLKWDTPPTQHLRLVSPPIITVTACHSRVPACLPVAPAPPIPYCRLPHQCCTTSCMSLLGSGFSSSLMGSTKSCCMNSATCPHTTRHRTLSH